MAKYMYLFRGGNEMGKMSDSEREQEMNKWNTWMGKLGASGKLIDGLPLGKGGKTITKKGTIITDGPFVEGKEIIGGYVVVKTANIDDAIAMTEGCPILDADNGVLEVRDVMELG